MKKTLSEKEIKFNSLDEAVNYLKKISKTKYNFDCSEIIKKSILLKKLKTEKILSEWF